jgi:hypothetical protein
LDKIKGSFGVVKDISLSVVHVETGESGDNTGLIVFVSVTVGLIFLAIVAVVVYLKRKMKPAEVPVVDDNMYYGNPGEDYVYGSTRVTDTNDYYEK